MSAPMKFEAFVKCQGGGVHYFGWAQIIFYVKKNPEYFFADAAQSNNFAF